MFSQQALKEEEELRLEVEEDEMYYTTEARCRQTGNNKKHGAEFFASLGDSGRGMHAGPMRACRYSFEFSTCASWVLLMVDRGWCSIGGS